MLQRAILATCLVVTIVSLSLTGMLWVHGTQTARQLAEAERRMAESLAETRTANQEMLRRLQAIDKRDQSTRAADWIPVKFTLTQETLSGPPAAGYAVYLGRGGSGSSFFGAVTANPTRRASPISVLFSLATGNTQLSRPPRMGDFGGLSEISTSGQGPPSPRPSFAHRHPRKIPRFGLGSIGPPT